MRRFLPFLIAFAACSSLALLQPEAGSAASSTPRAEVMERAKKLVSSDPVEAAGAAYWLARQGAKAVPAIPQLAAVLADDREVDPKKIRGDRKVFRGADTTTPGEEAAAALASIGEPAVDVLIDVLRNSPSAVARRNAVWALGAIQNRRKAAPGNGTAPDSSAAVRSSSARLQLAMLKPAAFSS